MQENYQSYTSSFVVSFDKIPDLQAFKCYNFSKNNLGGLFYLHETHPTISSHRQPVMIAKARDLHSNLFTGLKKRGGKKSKGRLDFPLSYLIFI